MRKELLEVVVSYVGGRACISVSGEVDSHSASTLRAVLDDLQPETEAAIDMADVRFINSKGLTVLAAQAVRMRQNGGRLSISNPSHSVRRAVAMSGLADLVCQQSA